MSAVREVQVEEIEDSVGRRPERPGRVVALAPNEEVIGVESLICDLDLPALFRQEGRVLDTQTGRRESSGLSALTRRRARKRHEREAD